MLGERRPLPPLHSLQLGDFSPTTNSSSHTHVREHRHADAAEVQEVTVHTLTAHKREESERRGGGSEILHPAPQIYRQVNMAEAIFSPQSSFPSSFSPLSNCPVRQGEVCKFFFFPPKGARFHPCNRPSKESRLTDPFTQMRDVKQKVPNDQFSGTCCFCWQRSKNSTNQEKRNMCRTLHQRHI